MQIAIAGGLTQTRSHWYWRPGWGMGRRMYTFHLTMERAPEIRALADDVRPTLCSLPALDPVPLERLHLTMNGAGFTDEVTHAQLDHVADLVFQTRTADGSRQLLFDRAVVSAEGFMLTAATPPWLAQLNRVQRQAIEHVLGPRQWGHFEPHVTLAYCNSASDPREIVQTLSPALSEQNDTLAATPTLTLMRIGRDYQVYEWDVIRQSAPT